MKTVFEALADDCTEKAKDLYRIMPPDNRMRRIVDASTVLAKAADAIRQLEAERCTNPLRSEITCDVLVRDNDALRAKLSAVAALPDKIRKLKEAKDLKHYAALLIEESIDADVQGGFTRDVFEAVRG